MQDCKVGHVFSECGWKPGKYRCVKCGTDFPCKAVECCGHFDCIENRKSAKCFHCRKSIPYGTDWFNVIVRGKTRAIHHECKDEFNSLGEGK